MNIILILIILFSIFFLLTIKETYFYKQVSFQGHLLTTVWAAGIEEDITKSFVGFKNKLIIIYCSGCEERQNLFANDIWNTIGTYVSSSEVSLIDLSRIDNPLDIVNGFIHPKYLKKESMKKILELSEEDLEKYNSNSEFNLLQNFFYERDIIVNEENKLYKCLGPQYVTVEEDNKTFLKDFENNLCEYSDDGSYTCKYENSDEYKNKECDYYLLYKTPTIIYEIKEKIYIKLNLEVPNVNSTEICTQEERNEYQIQLKNYILQIQAWVSYLEFFALGFNPIYNMLKIDLTSSCSDVQLEQLTKTAHKRDMFATLVEKYYNVLSKCYPHTNEEIKIYESASKTSKYYTGYIRDETTDKLIYNKDLDYLRVLDKYYTPEDPLYLKEKNYPILPMKRIEYFAESTLVIQINRILKDEVEFINKAIVARNKQGCNYIAIEAIKYIMSGVKTGNKGWRTIQKMGELKEGDDQKKAMLKALIDHCDPPGIEDTSRYFSDVKGAPTYYLMNFKKNFREKEQIKIMNDAGCCDDRIDDGTDDGTDDTIKKFDLEQFPITLTFVNGSLSEQDFSIEFHLFDTNEINKLGNKIIDNDNALANNQKIIQLALSEYGVLKTGKDKKVYGCDSGETLCTSQDVSSGILETNYDTASILETTLTEESKTVNTYDF